MQLEDYFVFEKFDTKFGPVERIRIKGHRIAIERVIESFHTGASPDQIQREHYPSLTLEEVYATITYYLHNKPAVDAYIAQAEKIADAFYQEWLQQEPSPLAKKLRELRARQKDAGTHEQPPFSGR
jgi:uncharacterized protein (DUF433 family)